MMIRRWAFTLLASILLAAQASAFTWIGRTVTTATANQYYGIDDSISGHNTEAIRQMPMPVAGTCLTMHVWASAAPGDAKSWTVTLRSDAAGTDMSATITGAATQYAVDTDDVAFAVGDKLAILVTSSGTPAAASLHWCIDYETTAGNQQIFGSCWASLSTAATPQYSAPKGSMAALTSERLVIPTAGTIDTFYVELSAAPGADGTRQFILQEADTNTDLVLTFDADDTLRQDDTNDVAVVAGDYTRLVSSYTGTVDGASAWISFAFTPTTSGQWILANCGGGANMDQAVTHYFPPSGHLASNATEADRSQYVREMSITNVYIWLSSAPGAGNTYTFDLRDDGADTALDVAIADTATTGNAAETVAIAEGSLLSTGVVPDSTPTNSRASISYTVAGDDDAVVPPWVREMQLLGGSMP